MKSKKNPKKSNPMAKELRSPKYKQRAIKSKKAYTRKGNKKVI